MDDSTRSAVLAALGADLDRLWTEVVGAEAGDLEAAEGLVRDGVLAIGARLLEASVAARGTGKDGARRGGGGGFFRRRPEPDPVDAVIEAAFPRASTTEMCVVPRSAVSGCPSSPARIRFSAARTFSDAYSRGARPPR